MIELPFPAKILWPNGRGHHMAKHRAFQKHKMWAYGAAKAATDRGAVISTPVQWTVTVYPKTRNAIDDDNIRGSLKAYQDGIAQAFGVDDKNFAAPRIVVGNPVKGGLFVVTLG